MRVVVLGGSGLIGAEVVRAFRKAKADVTVMCRSKPIQTALDPDIQWIKCDLAKTPAQRLRNHLEGADIVVNAAGALQNCLQDRVADIHFGLAEKLVAAIGTRPIRLIQISAAGVSDDAATDFFRTKARGDHRLLEAGLDVIILRPVMVIGAEAYGGTALLRAHAALPWILPPLYADRPIQTIYVKDLAQAVLRAAKADIPAGTVMDLAEEDAHDFQDLVGTFRGWLGYPPQRRKIPAAGLFLKAVAGLAGLAGWLGWRSSLRGNALKSLSQAITGDPKPWFALTGQKMRPLKETLADIPSTRQERWFAGLFLTLPVAIIALSMAAIMLGLLNVQLDGFKQLGMVGIGLTGVAMLLRPFTRFALGAFIALLAVLFAALVPASAMIAGALAPLFLISMVLALITRTLLQDR